MQSKQGFVPPASPPIKKSPDISDIISEPNVETTLSIANIADAKEVEKKARRDDIVVDAATQTPYSDSETRSNLATHWQTMFSLLFASVPTVYLPFKDSFPELVNNSIKFVVKNEIQKEHFEAKVREALEYLRSHYDEKIEEILVETNEKLETKKIIYDNKDKLQNLKEQNEEFEDFKQILDLQIKD